MSKTTQSPEKRRFLRESEISTLGFISFPDDHKNILLVGYLSLALEHHNSVTLSIGYTH